MHSSRFDYVHATASLQLRCRCHTDTLYILLFPYMCYPQKRDNTVNYIKLYGDNKIPVIGTGFYQVKSAKCERIIFLAIETGDSSLLRNVPARDSRKSQ